MQAAIIAGGLATRLGALAKDTPKSLMPLRGRPFIDYQLEFLKAGGITDIVLCLGYLGEKIANHCGDGRRYGLRIEYSFEKQRLDTAGALKLAEPLLHDPFFTLYGDSYVKLDYAAMRDCLVRSGKPAAMSVFRNCNQCDFSNTSIAGGMVTCYRKDRCESLEYIDYGVNLFRKSVLDLVPEAAPFSLGAVFQKLIERGDLAAFEVKERFYQIGSPESLAELADFLAKNK